MALETTPVAVGSAVHYCNTGPANQGKQVDHIRSRQLAAVGRPAAEVADTAIHHGKAVAAAVAEHHREAVVAEVEGGAEPEHILMVVVVAVAAGGGGNKVAEGRIPAGTTAFVVVQPKGNCNYYCYCYYYYLNFFHLEN